MISRKSLAIRRRKGLRQLQRWMHRLEDASPRDVGRAGTTPVPRSCFLCGNRRTKFKGDERLTVQERKAQEAASAEIPPSG